MLNEDGEVVDRGRFRTTPKGVERWFSDLPRRSDCAEWKLERHVGHQPDGPVRSCCRAVKPIWSRVSSPYPAAGQGDVVITEGQASWTPRMER
jgi:hypothetical protein